MANIKTKPVLQVRMEPEVKEKAESILYELGVTPAQAVKMFFSQRYTSENLKDIGIHFGDRCRRSKPG